jgi:hypothetical protein
MTANGERRYVVKISAYAGFDPDELTEDDLDEDQLEEIARMVRNQELPDGEETFKGFRFDLCPECHSRFIKDPLNRDLFRMVNFSTN